MSTHTANDPPAPIPRDKKPEAPYMWQSKVAMRKIYNSSFPSCLYNQAVYVALTAIASDQGNHTFCTSYSYIEKRSGVSRRKVIEAVKELVSIGVIAIQSGARERTENKYRILTMKGEKGALTQDKEREQA